MPVPDRTSQNDEPSRPFFVGLTTARVVQATKNRHQSTAKTVGSLTGVVIASRARSSRRRRQARSSAGETEGSPVG
jgi:hypothetical protein